MLFPHIGITCELYKSMVDISDSNSMSLSLMLMPNFPWSCGFNIPHAILGFRILSYIALLISFVASAMCPGTLPFVSYLTLQKGSWNLSRTFVFLSILYISTRNFLIYNKVPRLRVFSISL